MHLHNSPVRRCGTIFGGLETGNYFSGQAEPTVVLRVGEAVGVIALMKPAGGWMRAIMTAPGGGWGGKKRLKCL